MTQAADSWLTDFGGGDKRTGLRKTAKFRLIDLSVALAKESLNQPIDFLEREEIEATVSALSYLEIEDAAELSKVWIHLLDINEELANKIRGLDPYQRLRLILHVLNARK